MVVSEISEDDRPLDWCSLVISMSEISNDMASEFVIEYDFLILWSLDIVSWDRERNLMGSKARVSVCVRV